MSALLDSVQESRAKEQVAQVGAERVYCACGCRAWWYRPNGGNGRRQLFLNREHRRRAKRLGRHGVEVPDQLDDVRNVREPPPLVVSRPCPGCGGKPYGSGELPSYCTACANRIRYIGTTDGPMLTIEESMKLSDPAANYQNRYRKGPKKPPSLPEGA